MRQDEQDHMRELSILDCAPLRRGKLAVLELDAPNPMLGIAVGTMLTVVFRDGSRETIELKSLGFASSTPDHAHIVVTMPTGDVASAVRVEIPERELGARGGAKRLRRAEGSATQRGMSTLEFKGAYTALVTPFTEAGEVDWGAFEALVERQVVGGIAGLVPCGTTGETPTLTDAEQVELVRRAVVVAGKRAPVIAGTGSFSTKKTIEASRRALEAGASAVMVVMPYYSKPTQEGLVQHTVAVAAAVEAPVVLYNIPGRTGIDLLPEATERICEKAANVVATKEATGNVLRCQELKRRLGDRLTVLSGDDALTLPMMAVGAAGVISVTRNFFPAQVSELTRLVLAGDMAAARRLHFAMLPVHDAMFIEANPGPVKAACALKGWMRDTVRLPLVAPTEATRTRLAEALRAFEAVR
jgi:4-hydroxy-tetrahydrodipicolinate synthase